MFVLSTLCADVCVVFFLFFFKLPHWRVLGFEEDDLGCDFCLAWIQELEQFIDVDAAGSKGLMFLPTLCVYVSYIHKHIIYTHKGTTVYTYNIHKKYLRA